MHTRERHPSRQPPTSSSARDRHPQPPQPPALRIHPPRPRPITARILPHVPGPRLQAPRHTRPLVPALGGPPCRGVLPAAGVSRMPFRRLPSRAHRFCETSMDPSPRARRITCAAEVLSRACVSAAAVAHSRSVPSPRIDRSVGHAACRRLQARCRPSGRAAVGERSLVVSRRSSCPVLVVCPRPLPLQSRVLPFGFVLPRRRPAPFRCSCRPSVWRSLVSARSPGEAGRDRDS
jgi:hypothetical protein